MKEKQMNLKFEHYVLGILLAIEIIMSFTFLGYIHIAPISVTTAYVPIVIIACLFGPAESTVAGLLFGLGSMYKASAFYVMPDDKLFSPFQSGFPVGSILLSVGSRALFGLLIGLIFSFIKRFPHHKIGKGICALIAPKLHALLVYGTMGLFFPEKGFDYTLAFSLNVNDSLVSVICLLVVLISDSVYHSAFIIHYRDAINDTEQKQHWTSKMRIVLILITVFVLCMAIFSTIYFSNRSKYMLGVHGINVTDEIVHDIQHLQIQFLAAMVSLNFILILIILMTYTYMKYREFQGEIDGLTGVMGRRLFLRHCDECQRKLKNIPDSMGWFLFVDVDWFKSINDTFGHAVGDKTLLHIARYLNDTFNMLGAVGRMGGDEFAVIIEKQITRENLEEKLNSFLLSVSTILTESKVSCSIGAYHFNISEDMQEILSKTDEVLYQAKKNGRARFEIREN